MGLSVILSKLRVEEHFCRLCSSVVFDANLLRLCYSLVSLHSFNDSDEAIEELFLCIRTILFSFWNCEATQNSKASSIYHNDGLLLKIIAIYSLVLQALNKQIRVASEDSNIVEIDLHSIISSSSPDSFLQSFIHIPLPQQMSSFLWLDLILRELNLRALLRSLQTFIIKSQKVVEIFCNGQANFCLSMN